MNEATSAPSTTLPATLRQTLFVPPVPLVVAQAEGFLARTGIEVTTTLTRSSHEQRDQLMSGEQDAAVTAIDNLIVWNGGGSDIRMIAQVERTTSLGLYADPRFGSLRKLSGCRFAVDAVNNGFAIAAQYLLASQGVEDVQLIEVGGVRERLVALRDGSADATLLGPPLDEMAEQAGFVRLTDVNSLVPEFPGQGLMVRRSRLPELADALERYLGALSMAVGWSNAVSDEVGLALLAGNGFAGRAASTAWNTRPLSLGAPAEGLDVLVAMRRRLDMLPAGFPGVSSLYDGSLLSRAG